MPIVEQNVLAPMSSMRPRTDTCLDWSARVSLQSHASLYSEAKLQASRVMDQYSYVWLEAHPQQASPNLRLAKPEPISYAVHGSQRATDVPLFAVEVYEQGALSRYEVNRDLIADLALMSESERQTAHRAAQLRAQLTDAKASSPLSASQGHRPRM